MGNGTLARVPSLQEGVPQKMRNPGIGGPFAVSTVGSSAGYQIPESPALPPQSTLCPCPGSPSHTVCSHTSRSKCRVSGGKEVPSRATDGSSRPVTHKLQDEASVPPAPPPRLHPHTMLGGWEKHNHIATCEEREGRTRKSLVHSNGPVALASGVWACSGRGACVFCGGPPDQPGSGRFSLHHHLCDHIRSRCPRPGLAGGCLGVRQPDHRPRPTFLGGFWSRCFEPVPGANSHTPDVFPAEF